MTALFFFDSLFLTKQEKRLQMHKTFTIKKITDLFGIPEKKATIYRDEKKGLIPSAHKIPRGSSFARVWYEKDLPGIGKKFGFLSSPNSTKVISVFTPKGGVLKSTLTFNLARVLALNGIKVLVIGLDVQGTITNNLTSNIDYEINDIENLKEYKGLYESCTENDISIQDTILHTELPTLSYIPESPTLNFLEQKIRETNRREHFIQELIEPLYKDYEVILFDNSPNWNFLIQNSLVAATDVISPISCDIETFRSLALNIQMINDFKKKMRINWHSYTLIATKLEKNNLSSQIEARYKTTYPQLILNTSIRSSIKGQESSLEKISILEQNPLSELAKDYFIIIKELWTKINEN